MARAVPRRHDVGVVGPSVIVDHDAVVDDKTRIGGEVGVRLDADTDDDQICGDRFSEERLDLYMKSRDRYDHLLDDILLQCRREKSIADIPLTLTRLSILTMITGITSWFKPTGEASLDDLTAFYVAAVRRLVGANPDPSV